MSCRQLISVLLPVFNGSQFLSRAIESVVQQTYPKWELLVIDDGSTDDSAMVAERFSRVDERVRVLRKENRGISAALNSGLEAAKGEFIARMDGDDVCYPERFAAQLAHLKDSNADLIGCQVRLIDKSGRKLVRVDRPLGHEEIEAMLLKGDGSAIIHPAMFCRRSILEQVSGYREELRWMEDLDLYLRVAEIGRLSNVDRVLLDYRQHPNSVNHTSERKQLEFRKAVLREAGDRRGVDLVSHLESQAHDDSNCFTHWQERYRRWAWKALLIEGDRYRSLELFTQAVKLDPLNRRNVAILRSLCKSVLLPRRLW